MPTPPWTPIPKEIQRGILRATRPPFPEEVAYLSLSLDCDEHREVSVSGYAALWGWSRGKVARYLAKVGVVISYPDSTCKKQNQRGKIVIEKRTDREQIASRSPSKYGQIVLLNFNDLQDQTSRSREEGRQIADRSRVTTRDTDTETKESIPFSMIVEHLNTRSGKMFKATTKSTRSCITARWSEGFRLNDFVRVIDSRCDAWGSDPKMSEYLRPATLFGSKFESYLNAVNPLPPTDSEPTAEELRHRRAAQEIARAHGLE